MTEHSDAPPRGMSRRSLLGHGALAAAGSVVISGALPAAQAAAAGALVAPTRTALSIGYVRGSRGLSLAEARAQLLAYGTRVVPAARLASGAAGLRGGAVRVRVDGLTPGLTASERPRLRGVHVDGLFAPATEGDALRFYAWTLDRDAPGATSSPASFIAPVRSGPSFGFAQRLRRLAADGSTKWSEASTILTSGSEAGMAKLRPGTYLLGLRPETWGATRELPGASDVAWAPLASVVVLVEPA